MFGIGGGELILIAIVVLLAVGPNQMPKMIKTVGRGLREVRRATRELQATVGVDDLLREADIKVDTRDPLGLSKPAPQPKPVGPQPPRPARVTTSLSEDDLLAEQPAVGVDLDLAYTRAEAASASAAPTESAG